MTFKELSFILALFTALTSGLGMGYAIGTNAERQREDAQIEARMDALEASQE